MTPPVSSSSLTRPLQGIIFDCDGVLLDSRNANATYYNRVLAALDLPPLTQAQESYTYMATVREALLHITPEPLRPKLPEACATVDYWDDIMPLVHLEEGLLEFLQWLQGCGVRLAVHTNRSKGMPRVLDMFNLNPYFNPVITAAMVTPKPAPEGVFRVLEQWQCPPEHVLFIGDSPNDEQAAHSGGVPFVAYRNHALDAAIRVDSFRELTTILKEGPLAGDA